MKKTIIAVTIVIASTSAGATSSNNVQQQLDDLKAGLHQVHMNTLQKYSESWGLEDRANIAKLQEQKLDKSVFTADQQRQDDHINAVQSAAQSANEKADAGAVRMDGIERNVGAVQGAAQTANDRAGALEVRADAAESGIRETNAQLEVADKRSQNNAVRLDGAEKVNTRQDSDIKQLYSNGEYAQSRIDAANANIQANREALRNTNKVVSKHSAQLADHEQRLGNLEQSTNRNFAALKDKVERNKKDADAGIAGVAAMSSIPQVTEYQTFNVGAGVGSRHDQQALAVGFSARASQNVVIKVSAAADTNSGWTLGAGAAIGW